MLYAAIQVIYQRWVEPEKSAGVSETGSSEAVRNQVAVKSHVLTPARWMNCRYLSYNRRVQRDRQSLRPLPGLRMDD